MLSTKLKLMMITLVLVVVSSSLYYILSTYNTEKFSDEMIKSSGEKDLVTFSFTRTKSRKYLIYSCETQLCGGWANRIYGMVMTYMLARLSERNFRIKMTKPCDINLFLDPNRIDWKFSKSEVQNLTSQSINCVDSLQLKRSLPKLDLRTFFTSDVVYFSIDWDFTPELRLRQDIGQIAEFNQLTVAEIYRQTCDALFKYRPEIQSELDRYRIKEKGHNTLVCAHIRILDNVQEYKGNADVIWDWFKSYNNSNYVFYFATNRQKLKDKAKEMFPTHLTDLPGVITHIDHARGNDACPGFKKALMDHAILSSCDVLLLSSSGYGITSAYRRGTSKDLFYLDNDNIIPCSVDVLHEILIKNLGPHPQF